MVDVTLSYL